MYVEPSVLESGDKFTGLIERLYKKSVNSEKVQVTVSGDVDPTILIKQLSKNEKHAEFLSAPIISSRKSIKVEVEDLKCQTSSNNFKRHLKSGNDSNNDGNNGENIWGQKGGGYNGNNNGGNQNQGGGAGGYPNMNGNGA
ncbi:hypothetical protein RND71_024736 [Anisodus tanguticus]|uniref:Uncharacterized protein n=1 Tax=Anisodus tanguticus TaxID=243964 RepID=A0AAE1VCU7_9SOLA|nr:hypothetical protein RND71_024736 [Anisodus tanguticus]